MISSFTEPLGVKPIPSGRSASVNPDVNNETRQLIQDESGKRRSTVEMQIFDENRRVNGPVTLFRGSMMPESTAIFKDEGKPSLGGSSSKGLFLVKDPT